MVNDAGSETGVNWGESIRLSIRSCWSFTIFPTAALEKADRKNLLQQAARQRRPTSRPKIFKNERHLQTTANLGFAAIPVLPDQGEN
jgi:hypothetical protein